MKRNKWLTVLILSLGVSVFLGCQTMGMADVNQDKIGVVNTFTSEPQTGHNFSWYLPDDGSKSYIEYCAKQDFVSFEKSKMVRLEAEQVLSENDNDERLICKTTITGLVPGTEYVYRVGTDKGQYSALGYFETAPNQPEAFNFINITDTQGTSYDDYQLWSKTLKNARTNFPNARFLVHGGDFVENGDEIEQWDWFSETAQAELMNIPVVPVLGNHDVINDNESNPAAKNFLERFRLPENKINGAPEGTVYSFDYGEAHIAVINTDCDDGTHEYQAEWLLADMAKSNKQWKIVAMHKPVYGSKNDLEWLRNVWGPCFDEARVDLVLQGHDHSYVRTDRITNEQVRSDNVGIIYTVAGTGGIKRYDSVGHYWEAVNKNLDGPMYMAVGINGNRLWLGAFDQNNKMFDSVLITK